MYTAMQIAKAFFSYERVTTDLYTGYLVSVSASNTTVINPNSVVSMQISQCKRFNATVVIVSLFIKFKVISVRFNC